MSIWRLIFRNFLARPGLTAATIGAMAVGMAVMVGSATIGESVQATLHDLALRRLGPVTAAVQSAHGLSEALTAGLELAREGRKAAAVAMAPATVSSVDGDASAVIRSGLVLGVDETFWALGWRDEVNVVQPGAGGALISSELAADLNVVRGDDVILTIARESRAAADSVYGRRRLSLTRLRVTVEAVLSGHGADDFSINAGRQTAGSGGNLFVDRSWLNRQLGREGDGATVILVADADAERGGAESAELIERLERGLSGRILLRDFGLKLVTGESAAESGGAAAAGNGHWRGVIESERIVLDERRAEMLAEAARRQGLEAMAVSAYLMNVVRRVGGGEGRAEVPYVMLAGLDATSPQVELISAETGRKIVGKLGAGQVLVNSHLADELRLSAGDELEATFYIALADGSLAEEMLRLTVADVVESSGSGADELLSPHVEGLTDAETIRDWNPPFPIDRGRITDADERYWQRYRAAPRMLVSPATAQLIWGRALSAAAGESSGAAAGESGNRYITGLLVQAPLAVDMLDLEKRLAAELDARAMGLTVRDLRGEALEAAQGSSNYSALFAGLGMFLVAASAVLVALLVRLNVERRMRQTGLLKAVGFNMRQISLLSAGEALLLVLAAAIVAAPLGVVYSWGLMIGLNVLWPDALAGLNVALHVSWVSVSAGLLPGGLAAGGALLWGLAGVRRFSVRRLLAKWPFAEQDLEADGATGAAAAAAAGGKTAGGRSLSFPAALALLVTGGLAIAAGFVGLMSAVGAFFVSGPALLTGALLLVWGVLLSGERALTPNAFPRRWSVNRLAMQWLRHNRTRSILTVTLTATAAFILTAVAANRRDVDAVAGRAAGEAPEGAGGYHLMVETQLPLPVPLDAHIAALRDDDGSENGDDVGRSGGRLSAKALLGAAGVESLRLHSGDDISCLNAARPLSPRVVGVSRGLIEQGAFRPAAYLPDDRLRSDEAAGRPLRILELPPSADDGAIPVMGDEASLRWILGRRLGERFDIAGPHGPVAVRIVGLLRGSIWQSELLMSQENFVTAFGSQDGYRLFLLRTGDEAVEATAAAVAGELSQLGPRVTHAGRMLADYAAVQNAYLATFQMLGGLGLALGMLGLMTVMFRGAEQRRSELALLRAIGFGRSRIVQLLAGESAMLMSMGLTVGAVTALAAAWPQLAESFGPVAWRQLLLTLIIVWIFGLGCSILAALHISRGNLTDGLRRE